MVARGAGGRGDIAVVRWGLRLSGREERLELV
jgi:hypothetical protein